MGNHGNVEEVGSVTDVRIESRILSADEIAQAYRENGDWILTYFNMPLSPVPGEPR